MLWEYWFCQELFLSKRIRPLAAVLDLLRPIHSKTSRFNPASYTTSNVCKSVNNNSAWSKVLILTTLLDAYSVQQISDLPECASINEWKAIFAAAKMLEPGTMKEQVKHEIFCKINPMKMQDKLKTPAKPVKESVHKESPPIKAMSKNATRQNVQ